tara:strand:+ start:289 stop:513 length:225 start_codon:yes stop_codon:yes gene_type:complete
MEYVAIGTLALVIMALLRQLNCERVERAELMKNHQELAATIRYAQLSSEIENFEPRDLSVLRSAMASTHDVEGQ